MTKKIEIEWQSKDEAVSRSLNKTVAALDNLNRRMDKLEVSSKKATQEAAGGFSKASVSAADLLKSVTGIGSATAAAAAGVRRIADEWQHLKDVQKSAADANLSLAQVLPGTVRAAGGFLSPAEVEREVMRVARGTFASSASAATAITEGLTARAPQNRQEVMDAIRTVEAVMKFAPEADSQTMAAMAGGAVDLQKRYRVTPTQAVGFFEVAGGVGRVAQIRDQAQNMVPAIGGLTNFGASPAEAAAIFGSIALDTGDFSGASSKTASISLAKALQDRGFSDPMSGIRALQADPALRKAFLYGGRFGGQTFGKAPIEAAAFPTIAALLTAGSPQAMALEGAIPKVGGWADAQRAYERTAAMGTATQSGRMAMLQKTMASSAEMLRLKNSIGATGHITREGFSQMLDAVSTTALDKSTAMAAYEWATRGGTDQPVEDIARRLRVRAGGLDSPMQSISGGVGGAGVMVPRTVSEADSATASALRSLAGIMMDIATTNREMAGQERAPQLREPPARANGATR